MNNFFFYIKHLSPAYNFEKNVEILRKKNLFSKKISNIVEKNPDEFKKIKLGKKNKNKIFFVIQRQNINSGLFSNVFYVINKLSISEKNKFIPVVDMENFSNMYSEKKKIFNTHNVWRYYFKPLSSYKLEEVYSSQNVIFTDGKWKKEMNTLPTSYKFTKLTKKYIKINDDILKETEVFYKKNFKNKKILGIHFRGQELRYSSRHYFPATIKQMVFNTKNLIKKKKIDKIFLCTEEQKYLDIFIKEFKDKVFYYNTLRSYNKNRMYTYPRKNHRYLMGKETLIETLLLSKCNFILSTKNNVVEAARLFSKINNNSSKIFFINNGTNFSNPALRRWAWHIKSFLPSFLGGFKTKIKI